MTTCPKCDEISIKKRENIYGKMWHVSCDCGWAFSHANWFYSKHEAKTTWENFMNAREQAAKREEERMQIAM